VPGIEALEADIHIAGEGDEEGDDGGHADQERFRVTDLTGPDFDGGFRDPGKDKEAEGKGSEFGEVEGFEEAGKGEDGPGDFKLAVGEFIEPDGVEGGKDDAVIGDTGPEGFLEAVAFTVAVDDIDDLVEDVEGGPGEEGEDEVAVVVDAHINDEGGDEDGRSGVF